MKNDFVTMRGLVALKVADRDGNIRDEYIKPNAVSADMKNALGYSIFAGTLTGINDFATAAGSTGAAVHGKDGVVAHQATSGASATSSGSMFHSTTQTAASLTPHVVFTGSAPVSHTGSVKKFALGYNFTTTGGTAGGADVEYCTQSANIAVTSGDTISVTWTASVA